MEKSLESAPLLIVGDPGSGKSSLIAKWLEYHHKFHLKDNNLIYIDNPSLTSTPTSSHTLYNLINRIRREYDISQGTSTSENTLRMNFSKMLETVSSSQPSNSVKRNCVIIIFDGVDLYKEAGGREESAEWLPSFLPDAVKLIYTCTRGSSAEQVLSEKTKVVHLGPIDPPGRKKILQEYLNRYPDMKASENLEALQKYIRKNACCGNPLYLSMLVLWSLSSFPGVPNFPLPDPLEVSTAARLFRYSIDHFSPYFHNAVEKVLGCLAVCKYSLSKEEIALSCGISLKLAGGILHVYDNVLKRYEDLYFFANAMFRECVNREVALEIPKAIAEILDEQCYMKRTDELLHALWMNSDWKSLKEKLRNIVIFGSLYTQSAKLDLCKYWVDLEKNNFDPVEEYNKCIEDFVNANQTIKNEEIVLVLLNLFHFFYEYGEVECPRVSVFRHYPLISPDLLEDLNLLPELKKYPDIFNPEVLSPMFAHEKFITEESSISQIREKVLAMDEESQKQKRTNCFHYKRWLWIQFPWIVLSPSTNASVMLETLRGKPVSLSYEGEKDFNNSFMKLILAENTQKVIVKTRSQSSKPLLHRASTSQGVMRKAGLGPIPIMQAEGPSDRSKLNTSASFSRLNLSGEAAPETYQISFSLKDTGINTVLLKLDSQLVRFSKAEFNKKHKEVVEMQKMFNRMKEIQRIKKQEIGSIETQISHLKAKYREKFEVIQKINLLQHQTNKNLEKLVITQSEGDYLANICCTSERNLPFKQEWNNEIITSIHACDKIINSEIQQIEIYNHDTFEYNFRSSKLKPLITEKRKFGTNTLEKLSEKYSLNAYINKSIVQGYNRRKVLLSLPETHDNSSLLRSKILTRKKADSKLKVTKMYLQQKIDHFENLFAKLRKLSNQTEKIEIAAIISRFEERGELIQQKKDLENILESLKLEKIHLEERLQYIVASKPAEIVEEEPKDFSALSDTLFRTENKVVKLHEKLKEQELNLIKIKEITAQLWKRLKIKTECEINSKTVKQVYNTMGEFVEELNKNVGFPLRREVKQQEKPQLTKLWDKISEKYLFY